MAWSKKSMVYYFENQVYTQMAHNFVLIELKFKALRKDETEQTHPN